MLLDRYFLKTDYNTSVFSVSMVLLRGNILEVMRGMDERPDWGTTRIRFSPCPFKLSAPIRPYDQEYLALQDIPRGLHGPFKHGHVDFFLMLFVFFICVFRFFNQGVHIRRFHKIIKGTGFQSFYG